MSETPPPAGHNVGTVQELADIVDAIEDLEAEKAQTSTAIKDRYAMAKGRGYDVKAIRRLIRERKRKPEDVEEEDALVELYRDRLKAAAVDMLTP